MGVWRGWEEPYVAMLECGRSRGGLRYGGGFLPEGAVGEGYMRTQLRGYGSQDTRIRVCPWKKEQLE